MPPVSVWNQQPEKSRISFSVKSSARKKNYFVIFCKGNKCHHETTVLLCDLNSRKHHFSVKMLSSCMIEKGLYSRQELIQSSVP